MTPTHLIRFTQTVVLTAIVAVFAAPIVLATPPPASVLANRNTSGAPTPDVFERYVAAHPFGRGVLDTSTAPDVFERYVATHAPTALIDGRSPDTLDAADTSTAEPAWFKGLMARSEALNRTYHLGTYAQLQVVDGRSPDTRDAAGTAQLQVVDGRSPDTLDAAGTAQLQVADGRSPDTLDAAQAVQPIELVSSGRFDWSDAGIGAGIGAALILLMGTSMLLLLRVHRRDHVQAT